MGSNPVTPTRKEDYRYGDLLFFIYSTIGIRIPSAKPNIIVAVTAKRSDSRRIPLLRPRLSNSSVFFLFGIMQKPTVFRRTVKESFKTLFIARLAAPQAAMNCESG